MQSRLVIWVSTQDSSYGELKKGLLGGQDEGWSLSIYRDTWKSRAHCIIWNRKHVYSVVLLSSIWQKMNLWTDSFLTLGHLNVAYSWPFVDSCWVYLLGQEKNSINLLLVIKQLLKVGFKRTVIFLCLFLEGETVKWCVWTEQLFLQLWDHRQVTKPLSASFLSSKTGREVNNSTTRQAYCKEQMK